MLIETLVVSGSQLIPLSGSSADIPPCTRYIQMVAPSGSQGSFSLLRKLSSTSTYISGAFYDLTTETLVSGTITYNAAAALAKAYKIDSSAQDIAIAHTNASGSVTYTHSMIVGKTW